ncbi:MAG TPA: hypothetical protein VFD72_05585 [Sphingobacteriaceae bacterium]|nr:hypothetical protein [Sphingobacteriaceae bacterium]
MKAIRSFCILLLCFGLLGIHGNEVFGQQPDTIRLNKLELKRGAKKVFDSKNRDSVLFLQIDTLIMKDRSSLQFFGIKKVNLLVNHAEVGKRVYFSGRSQQNNASDMDISIKFDKLGSLFVMADGYDASNGFRTDPNGDGGNVKFVYSSDGIHPQQQQSKDQNYLHINTLSGGRHVNATADVQRIMDHIRRSSVGLRGLPQGQVYSGSSGSDGKFEVSARPGDPKSW